jgi:hypothetical protein
LKAAVRNPFQRRSKTFRSADYWRERYKAGRTSGAGSSGRLAAYKAEFINALVAERRIGSVIEFGSGDGSQASLFDFPDYTGVDVVPQVVEAARRRFADRPGWRFVTADAYAARPTEHDLAMSLDVIYHLVEDEVFEDYMRRLTAAARRFVLVYASDRDAAVDARHVRHRRYSRWMAESAPEFEAAGSWENPYPFTEDADPTQTSFAFFRLYARRPGG